MIKQHLQNMFGANNLIPCQSLEQHYLPEVDDAGFITRAIRGLRRYLSEINRKQALEAENRKAIEHLHGLTDEQLRDVGITRMDISRAVRFGKDNI